MNKNVMAKIISDNLMKLEKGDQVYINNALYTIKKRYMKEAQDLRLSNVLTYDLGEGLILENLRGKWKLIKSEIKEFPFGLKYYSAKELKIFCLEPDLKI